MELFIEKERGEIEKELQQHDVQYIWGGVDVCVCVCAST